MGTEMQVQMPNNGVRGNVGVKKKIVYNMYRDMLKNYNERANEILETKPASCLTEDRGIVDRVECMARQTIGDHMSNEYNNGIPSGGAAPPPPPPLALGAVPAVRLKSEISERRPEPPACVQNAMLTKDKKPFTYTPGGLDLSQIRSPRMAKRITRNANAEGVGAVPPSPQGPHSPPHLPPSALAAMQPQTPVQVFPAGGPAPPPPPPPPGPGTCPAPMAPPPPPSAKAPSPPNTNSLPPYQRPDIKIPENPMGLLRKTGGPKRPQGPIIGPDEEITKQPIISSNGQFISQPQPSVQPVSNQSPPVQQPIHRPVQPPVFNQSPPVQQSVQQPIYRPVQPPVQQSGYRPVQPPQQVYQPVQAPQQVYQSVQPQQHVMQPTYQTKPVAPPSPEHKPENRAQIGTLYIPPLNSEEIQQQKGFTNQKSVPDSPGSPLDTLKKAPTPWMMKRAQPRQQEVPSWARSPPESNASTAPSTPATPNTPATPATPAPSSTARVIPIRIEKTGDATVSRDQYQQQQEQQLQQQQRQFQQQQTQFRQQQHYQQQQQQQQQHVRVIPIQIEGRSNSGPMSPTQNNVSTPDFVGDPVQSPTFRILQRVTSRDEEIHNQPAIHHPPTVGHAFPVDQMRRMQLSDDDKSLMNRVRNQVDEATFLHSEEDPRYRGPAIPSRAFRMLQNMTDAAEASGDPNCVPRAVIVNRGPQPGVKRNPSKGPEGDSLPASEQREPEPRKYTGSAIPSRSFQMLQAMVAPENCANGTETDENNTSYPYNPNYYPWCYDPMYPPPPIYCFDPYWGYYQDPNSYPAESNVQPSNDNVTREEGNEITDRQNAATPTHSQENYYSHVPYWDPYYAYYYYGFYSIPPPHPYSPHAFYHSNETDDYSSTDEMSYYAARFPRGPPPCGRVTASHKTDEVAQTDTEVEEIDDNEEQTSKVASKKGCLQTIRSVSDIQVYNDSSSNADEHSSVTEEDTECSESESEEDENSNSTEEVIEDTEHLPHQLSVIYEESDVSESDRRKRETSITTTISEDDSSTTIGGDHCDEQTDESCDEDLEETSVTVRLPLKLKFGKSENGKQDVTEVTVGDSEVEPNTPENSVSVSFTLKSPITVSKNNKSSVNRQHSEETIENYDTADEMETNDTRDNSPVQLTIDNEEDEIDFWEEINKTVKSDDDCDNYTYLNEDNIVKEVENDECLVGTLKDGLLIHVEESVNIENEQGDENEISSNDNISEEDKNVDGEESSSDSDDDSSDKEVTYDCTLEKDLRDAFASDAIKKRVRKLLEAGKESVDAETKEETISVRQRIIIFENGGPSRSSSLKGCDLSEEDGDSGVTSDVSRHTDTESECSPEKLKKRYERAATHSRLYKLLQDECAKNENDNDNEEKNTPDLRKQHLTLPLNNSEPESFSSSGICSPSSPTWIARELVNGLLYGRQGRKYRTLPLEKLYAAAQRILQEDTLSYTSEDGSPVDSYTSDYRSYYNSWEDAGAATRCSSVTKKRLARCPRVKSVKNLAAETIKVVENVEDTQTNPSISRSHSPSRSAPRQQATSAS